jgi:hypothetical protein
MFWASLEIDGKEVAEYGPDYVPDWMPDEHWGDYVYLDIDPETGVILNWEADLVMKFVKRGLA